MEWTPERMHDRRWWTLGVLCVSLTVISIDNTILNVAIPSIVRDLGAQQSQLQWLIDAYTIVFACLLLTAGSLGDKLGRKSILTAGLIVFGLCSLGAALSPNANTLILCRGVMGVGGAMIFPSTLSILTNTFSGKERAKAIGVWAGVSGLGVAIGPLGGGFLLDHFWWGSVFLVNLPVCAAAVLLGRVFVPPSRNPDGHGLDPFGALFSILGLLGVLYAIIEVPDKGWSDHSVLLAFVVGAIFLGSFAWWETHTDEPMLDLRFFKNPRFTAASATITLTFLGLFGSTFLLTQYFQFVLGYSPLKAGVMTAPVAVGLMAMAPNTHRFVERWGTTKVVVSGLSVVATMLLLFGSDTLMSSVAIGMLLRGVFGAGMGLTMAPATESIMGSLPKEKAGVGSAVNDTTRQTGGAAGVAILGSLFAFRYHKLMGTLPGLPRDVAAAAHDSIGKAMAAAAHLPADQAGPLVAAARHAYIASMRVGMWSAAAIVLCAAMVAAKFLPAYAPVQTDPEVIAAETELLALDDSPLV